MAGKFLELAFTPNVLAAQQKYFGRSQQLPPQPERDALVSVGRYALRGVGRAQALYTLDPTVELPGGG